MFIVQILLEEWSSQACQILDLAAWDIHSSVSFLPEGVCERHDGVADELELRLELRVGRRQPLPPRAPPRVVPVVRRRQAPGVAALEVVLPELCNQMQRGD